MRVREGTNRDRFAFEGDNMTDRLTPGEIGQGTGTQAQARRHRRTGTGTQAQTPRHRHSKAPGRGLVGWVHV